MLTGIDEQRASCFFFVDAFRQVVAAVEAGELTTASAANTRLDAPRHDIEALADRSGDFAAQKQRTADRSLERLVCTGDWLNLACAALCTLGCVVAIAWSVYFPRRLTRPLADLSEVARRMAAGDLAVRAGLSGADEVGTLGRAFDQMAATVE